MSITILKFQRHLCHFYNSNDDLSLRFASHRRKRKILWQKQSGLPALVEPGWLGSMICTSWEVQVLCTKLIAVIMSGERERLLQIMEVAERLIQDSANPTNANTPTSKSGTSPTNANTHTSNSGTSRSMLSSSSASGASNYSGDLVKLLRRPSRTGGPQ